MIFFGSRGRTIQGEIIRGFECPHCGQHEAQAFGVQSYFHLYWIPVFPTTRTVGLVCTHCAHTRAGDDLPEDARARAREGLFSPKNTAPMFAGLFLIALITAWGVQVSNRNEARDLDYLATPLEADVYVVNLSKIFEDSDPDFPYGILQVIAVEGHQVDCRMGSVVYSGSGGPKGDIEKNKVWNEDYYAEHVYHFEVGELVEMRGDGAISEVERLTAD